jgi:heme A synthase
MYPELQQIHSYTAYLSLAGLLIAILYSAWSLMNKNPFSKMIAVLGLALTHLQIVLGLVLYFVSPLGFSNFSGANMKDTVSRLYMLEHPLTMIIAAVLITIGYSKAKRKAAVEAKHKQILIFYMLGLLLILLRIPWSAWP